MEIYSIEKGFKFRIIKQQSLKVILLKFYFNYIEYIRYFIGYIQFVRIYNPIKIIYRFYRFCKDPVSLYKYWI